MKDRSVIILHGSFGSPFENWFGWLYAELAKLDVRCFVLHLPTPEGQTYGNWARIVNGYRDSGCLNETSTLIAHSSAAPFAVRYISTESVRLDRLVTVSGFDAFLSGDKTFDAINQEVFTRGADDFKLVHDLVARRVSYYSKNDPYIPIEKLILFADGIGATHVQVDDAGHFNEASGYNSFPDLLRRLTES